MSEPITPRRGMRQLGKCIVTCITQCGTRTVGTVNFSPRPYCGSFTSAAWT